MAQRRGRTADAGIADENVELAVALMQRRAEPRDALEIGEVERHQRGAAATFTDLVVEFLEAALRSRHRHDMRTGLGECEGRGIADAAGGAGNEGDTGGEGLGHVVRFTDVDGRDKPGHDEKSGCIFRFASARFRQQ